MKSVFTLNTFIASALESNRINLEQLVNAVQASLNSAIVTKAEPAKRGAVKLVKDDEGTKGGSFRFNEAESYQYTGKTDAPARFARWHDAQCRVFKVCGDPAGFSVESIPVPVWTWVNDTFNLDKPKTPKTPKQSHRNGDIKPNVPAAEVPKA